MQGTRRLLSLLLVLSSAAVSACSGGSDPIIATLEADATAERIVVTYSLDGVEERIETEPPWSRDIEVDGDFTVRLTVENPTDEGNVGCRISRLVPTGTSTKGELSATCSVRGTASSDGVSARTEASSIDRQFVPTAEEFASVGLETVETLKNGLISVGLPAGWEVTSSQNLAKYRNEWTKLSLWEIAELESSSGESFIRVFVQKHIVGAPPLDVWTKDYIALLLESGITAGDVEPVALYQTDGLAFSAAGPDIEIDVFTLVIGDERIAIAGFHPAGTPIDDELRQQARTIATYMTFAPE